MLPPSFNFCPRTVWCSYRLLDLCLVFLQGAIEKVTASGWPAIPVQDMCRGEGEGPVRSWKDMRPNDMPLYCYYTVYQRGVILARLPVPVDNVSNGRPCAHPDPDLAPPWGWPNLPIHWHGFGRSQSAAFCCDHIMWDRSDTVMPCGGGLSPCDDVTASGTFKQAQSCF